MYNIDQGKAEVNESNMRKMATEITKILSGLLDPNCGDEEPRIPQSVREIDEEMFDGLEEKIRTLEAEEAARRQEKDVDRVVGNLKDSDIPKLEALVNRLLPFDNPTPGEADKSYGAVGAAFDNVSVTSDADGVNNTPTNVVDNPESPNESDAVVETTSGSPHMDNVNSSSTEERHNDVVDDANVDATDATVAEKTSSATTIRSPMVTVECSDNISLNPSNSLSQGGGVVIDMSKKVGSQKSTRKRVAFPMASASHEGAPFDRAVFPADADADDGLIVDPFSDDEEEIPEDAISNMTQKHKKPICEKLAAKPKSRSSTEESGGSQLSENASMNFINDNESDDTNGAEKDEVHDDAASKTGNNDEADEMEGVNEENGDVQRESEDEEGNGDENKGKDGDGEEDDDKEEDRVEDDDKGEDEEEDDDKEEAGEEDDDKEEAGGGGESGDEEEGVHSEKGKVANEAGWIKEGNEAAAVLQDMMKPDEAPVDSASNEDASSPTKSLYSKAFADEGDVNLSRNGAPALRLGPKNGVRMSDLKRNQAGNPANKSVFTPKDPLIPDPSAKKQVLLTDKFGKVLGKETNKAAPLLDPNASSPSKSSNQSSNGKENAQPSLTGKINGKSASSSHQSAPQKPSSNTTTRPSSSNVSVGDKIATVAQKAAPQSTSSASQKSGAGKSPPKRKSNGGFEYKSPKMPNLEIGLKSNDLPIVKKAPTSIKKSKDTVHGLPSRLSKKICSYCFTPFPGKSKSLTPRDHILTGSCDFVRQNCVSIGVDKQCSQCDTRFVYGKGMYEDIISHFGEKNHDVVCYLCGIKLKFLDIFTHMAVEVKKSFGSGIQCKKCNIVQRSALEFYQHIKVYHSAKELNVSVFNRHLYDSHPNYNTLLVSLLLTHHEKT